MKKMLSRSETEERGAKRVLRERQESASRDAFVHLYEQHGEALIRYCRFLTRSAPEAEDLLQESWLKAWSFFQKSERVWNRTYLRRIAYHAWIDRMRRTQLEQTADARQDKERDEEADPLRLWSAAERLVQILTPDQRTAYLLMEYMRFTAAETAELMHTTEGGVKASLHRARKKLGDYGKREQAASPERKNADSAQDEQAIYAYMEAIRLQDVRALLVLWNGGSGEEAALAVRCTTAAGRPVRMLDAAPLKKGQTVMAFAYSSGAFSSGDLRRAA